VVNIIYPGYALGWLSMGMGGNALLDSNYNSETQAIVSRATGPKSIAYEVGNDGMDGFKGSRWVGLGVVAERSLDRGIPLEAYCRHMGHAPAYGAAGNLMALGFRVSPTGRRGI